MTTRDDHYNEGFDHFASGRMEEAIACYRRAIEIDPKFTDGYEALAQACFHFGRFDDAIAVARRWAEIDRDNPMPHTNLSIFYQRKGMVPEAEAEGALSKQLSWKAELRAMKGITRPTLPGPSGE
ncbi:MAG: tetratricopeptide repeat protein [Planctomycetes bacterium]|nr:tetratricopeptide repeat protein [Planctomycetota bacterium]MBI3847524.1 tetratricopeptide repeat protein [Planctomycetota bacterium]